MLIYFYTLTAEDLTCKVISTGRCDVRKHIKSKRLAGIPADLVRKLVQARHSHGWSQRDLASKVGLPQVHISAIETGKVAPRFNTLLDLVRILDQDLVLVPRSLVPAVQALIRDAEPSANRDSEAGERPLYADDSGGEHES